MQPPTEDQNCYISFIGFDKNLKYSFAYRESIHYPDSCVGLKKDEMTSFLMWKKTPYPLPRRYNSHSKYPKMK